MAVGATAVWRVRPSGDNTNGGGYDAGISSPGTDYSQQDAAHVTFNGTSITATTAGVGATITITGYTVATTDVANVLHITGGTNFTTGWYFITSVNTGTGTWTLDRNCTSGAGSAMTGKMGGGWADPFTNMTTSGPIVAGNNIYVLGSGIPNPASYTFDYTITSYANPAVSGDTTNGLIVMAGDPATPSFSSGGMPCILHNNFIWALNLRWRLQDMWFVENLGTDGRSVMASSGDSIAHNCVFDQNGYDTAFTGDNGAFKEMTECELFSSHAKRSTNSVPVYKMAQGFEVIGCNIHDCIGDALFATADIFVVNRSLITNNAGKGIKLTSNASGYIGKINFCTIDGNAGHGIEVPSGEVGYVDITNNIISNQLGAGKAGISVAALTLAQNDRVKWKIDYNVFYNNTSDLSGISYGANDTHGGSGPFIGQSTQNYTLINGVITYANGSPGRPFLQHLSGKTTTVQSYLVPGATQPLSGPAAPTLLLGI